MNKLSKISLCAVPLLLSIFFAGVANATYHIDFFAVQNRVFENGNHLNRLLFDCKNAKGQYSSADILRSVVLTDPNGKAVNVSVNFQNYLQADGYYDASDSRWVYRAPYSYGYYWYNFPDQLIPGTYHLKVTDKDGELSEKDFVLNQIVALPIIPTSSYSFHKDRNGDTIWRWQAPDCLDPGLQTSVRACVDCYDENYKLIAELIVRVPTQMGFLFLPKTEVDRLLSIGKKFGFGTHIRTNDNNNRSYSNGLRTSSFPVSSLGSLPR